MKCRVLVCLLIVALWIISWHALRSDMRMWRLQARVQTLSMVVDGVMVATNVQTAVESLNYVLIFDQENPPDFGDETLEMLYREHTTNAIQQIIAQLRAVTGADYGTDPSLWVEALGTNTVRRLKAVIPE